MTDPVAHNDLKNAQDLAVTAQTLAIVALVTLSVAIVGKGGGLQLLTTCLLTNSPGATASIILV